MPVPETLDILLIESRGGIARALMSGQTGFNITPADRISKASALVADRGLSGFAAILVDLTLADSQGLESFRRAAALMPGTPLVALRPAGDPALADTLILEGAQACLVKDGLDGGALAQAVRQAVLRHRIEGKRYRALFDSAPIGILLAAGRRVAMANPAALEILACSEADLTRVSVLDLFPDEAKPILEKALDAGDEDFGEIRFSADLRRAGGAAARCQVFLTGALLNNAPAVAVYIAALGLSGSAASSATAATDSATAESKDTGSASERAEGASDQSASGVPGRLTPKEHESQARKMEALGRLAGGVAHDFNNLLTAINGYSEHLLTLSGQEGPIASGLKAIRRAGETAASLTRSLMSFSRPEGAEPRLVRVDTAVQEMAPMLQRLLGPQIDFRMRLGGGAASVRMEPGQLEQIVLNLCVNARDAMPQGGVLTVATDPSEVTAQDSFTHLAAGAGPHVMVSVDDTGTGMLPEVLERLFEPFYTTKRGGRGTGLGLANVYGIVSQTNGGISVSSVPGMGSRFRVYLRRDAAEAGPEAVVETPAWKPQQSRETVLVVEDEPSLREMIATILKRYGFDVMESASAAEAIDMVTDRGDGIDLVVTDIMLRGEGGHELANTLATLKPGLRTAFISGHSLDSLADRGIFVPADAFLEKPFSPAQLAAKVRSLLDAARKAG